MTPFDSDTTTTGPIRVTAGAPAARDESTFNLVACALAVGAVGLAASSSPLLGPLAVALSLIAMTLSILGVATGRRYLWAGWIGAVVAGIAVVLSWAVLSGAPLPTP